MDVNSIIDENDIETFKVWLATAPQGDIVSAGIKASGNPDTHAIADLAWAKIEDNQRAW